MNRNIYLGIGATAALALSVACTVTDDTSAGGGGVGGTTSSSSSGTGGTTSGTGGDGGTTSGTGGGGGCASCYGMLDDENVVYEDMCMSSAVLWDTLSECVCGDGQGTAGLCESECEESCGTGSGGGGGVGGGGGAGGGMDCQGCMTTQCANDYNACSSDV